jgi:1,4-alpha-glucan branching enzyme
MKAQSFFNNRNNVVKDWMKSIDESEGGLENFSQGYKYYGIHIQHDNSVIAREWAPGAKELYLTGDFSEFKS